eukprot:3800131-Prymnesium_polylepis.1
MPYACAIHTSTSAASKLTSADSSSCASVGGRRASCSRRTASNCNGSFCAHARNSVSAMLAAAPGARALHQCSGSK